MVVLNIPTQEYTTTDYDDKYNSLTQLLYSKFFSYFYKQKLNSEIGKDAFCYYDELNYLLILSTHIIEFAIEWQEYDLEDRVKARYDELVEKYKLNDIRKQMNCRFNNGSLLDKMLQAISGNYTLQEGIGFWIIEDTLIIS